MLDPHHRRASSWNTTGLTESRSTGRFERNKPMTNLPNGTQSVAHLPQITARPLPRTLGVQFKGHKNTKSYSTGSTVWPASRRTNSTVDVPQLENHVSKCAYATQTGTNGAVPKAFNQDNFLVKPMVKGVSGQHLFVVCDGHGAYGHHISAFVRDKLAQYIEDFLPRLPGSEAELVSAVKSTILKTINELNATGIDLAFSGTTLVCFLVRGALTICANIGDSRGLLGRAGARPLQLTSDHKPENPGELARIRKNGGRVAACRGRNGRPVGVTRVWLKHMQLPGLAMSRSIGDKVASSVGVISEPEVFVYSLQPCDRFVVLASDGIWEYLSNQEVVDIVTQGWELGNPELSSQLLVNEAVRRWQELEHRVDDITVIVLFLRKP